MELRCIRLGLKIVLGLVPLLPGAVWAMPPLQGAMPPAQRAMPPVQRAMPPVQRAADIHPALWPEQPSALAADPALEARIGQYSSEMTLEQKAGPLIQADIRSLTPDDLRHYPLGSTLNGGSSSPGNNEFAPPGKWLEPADRFYAAHEVRATGRREYSSQRVTGAVVGDWNGHGRVPGCTSVSWAAAINAGNGCHYGTG